MSQTDTPRPLYLDRIRPFIGKDVIKIITGIRRSGKSTMFRLIQHELISERHVNPSHIISVNLEAFSNRKLRNAETLYEHVTSRINSARNSDEGNTADMFYVFLDEIQEVPSWEQLVTGMQVEGNVDLYLTGSNSHFLSSEFATYLSGRYVQFRIYPYSFAEYMQTKTITGHSIPVDEGFDQYRMLGGFPFLANLDYAPNASKDYLRDIYNTVVLKDMVEHDSIKDSAGLSNLLPYLIANIGHPFSARKIQQTLRADGISIAPGTILKYVQSACDAWLLYRAQREDASSRKILTTQEKYYVADHGLREAIYGGNDSNIDQVLENIIFMELLRYEWQVTVGSESDEIHHSKKPAASGASASSDTGIRSRSPKKIDFIASKGNRRLYIQVSYIMETEHTLQREFTPLENLHSSYPKYVLSLDRIDRGRNGIQHRYIPDFLLHAGQILG